MLAKEPLATIFARKTVQESDIVNSNEWLGYARKVLKLGKKLQGGREKLVNLGAQGTPCMD